MSNLIKLGVNIDHIATIREARKTNEPDPVAFAYIAEEAGADGITAHLREDRRHIQDNDILRLKHSLRIPLNLEMSLSEEIIRLACKIKPNFVCLVPEKREEVTTEGGLDVLGNQSRVAEACKRLQAEGIKVSLFINPEVKQIEASSIAKADIVELHTGEYANLFFDEEKLSVALSNIVNATKTASLLGLRVNAGHGLTYHNVQPIAAIEQIEELNIGHSIVSRAVMSGFREAVSTMKLLIREARCK